MELHPSDFHFPNFLRALLKSAGSVPKGDIVDLRNGFSNSHIQADGWWQVLMNLIAVKFTKKRQCNF